MEKRIPCVFRPPQVYLGLEIHCFEPDIDKATIWVSGHPESERETVPGVSNQWVEGPVERLVGPIPYNDCERILAVLKRQLQAAGIDVAEECYADD